MLKHNDLNLLYNTIYYVQKTDEEGVPTMLQLYHQVVMAFASQQISRDFYIISFVS